MILLHQIISEERVIAALNVQKVVWNKLRDLAAFIFISKTNIHKFSLQKNKFSYICVEDLIFESKINENDNFVISIC